MAYRVVVAQAARDDVFLILTYLAEAAETRGETPQDALDMAEKRVEQIVNTMLALGSIPFQGTLSPDLGAAIRHVTRNRAIFYFEPDPVTETLHVLAVFYGGQDHQAHMVRRRGQTPE